MTNRQYQDFLAKLEPTARLMFELSDMDEAMDNCDDVWLGLREPLEPAYDLAMRVETEIRRSYTEYRRQRLVNHVEGIVWESGDYSDCLTEHYEELVAGVVAQTYELLTTYQTEGKL